MIVVRRRRFRLLQGNRRLIFVKILAGEDLSFIERERKRGRVADFTAWLAINNSLSTGEFRLPLSTGILDELER